MSFAISNSNAIYMCTGDNLLTYDLKTHKETTINLPKWSSDKHAKLHNNIDIESYHGITAVIVSGNGEFLCTCTNRIQLCLYERSSMKLLSTRTLTRAASKVIFTPDNNIVVADKSGDAYLYSTSKPEESGVLLLGHLSMLLDVLVTSGKNNDYIITADRDEKIRVSNYPNTYNIQSYCLGHENFVTALAILLVDKGYLVSAGGDGCIRFHDYRNGEYQYSISFKDKIPMDDIDKFNESLEPYGLSEKVETLPVKNLRILGPHDHRTITVVAVSFYGSKTILAFILRSSFDSNFPTLVSATSITLDEEPLDFLFQDNELWVLNDLGIEVYDFVINVPDQIVKSLEKDEEMKKTEYIFRLNECKIKNLEELNKNWSLLRSGASKHLLYPILYKRKFDNVQEYQERKKLRLEPSASMQ